MTDNINLESSLTELKFRVLTIGRTGTGKTSLIKATFKIGRIQASDSDPGKCDIEEELTSEHNPYFILHDSQGFEPGENENFTKVQQFLEKRLDKNQKVKERLHAVWLCIQIPKAGGRLIEAAEEELFKLNYGDVPMIIVFTQYDRLEEFLQYTLTQRGALKGMSHDEKEQKIKNEAEKYFRIQCSERLQQLGEPYSKFRWVKASTNPKHSHTLDDLTGMTEKLVRPYISREVWEAGARAQRVTVDWKIEASIEVGFKKYWQGLASGAHFAGKRLKDCLDRIHEDVVDHWNFWDDEQLLHDVTFKAQMIDLIQELARSYPESPDPNSGVMASLDNIKKVIDVVTPFGGPATPIVAGVGLGFTFTQWLLGTYSSTPGTLRAFLGYIVNLTLTLETLFWITSAQPKPRPLTTDDIDAAYHHYNQARRRSDVHREIRLFVDGINFLDMVNGDKSHQELKRLIEKFRYDTDQGNELKNSPAVHDLSSLNTSEGPLPSNDHSEVAVKPQELNQPITNQKSTGRGILSFLKRKKK